MTSQLSSTLLQIVPNSVRGAVLGFASRAPSNSGALSVSFGNSGIPLALARLFKRVMFNDKLVLKDY